MPTATPPTASPSNSAPPTPNQTNNNSTRALDDFRGCCLFRWFRESCGFDFLRIFLPHALFPRFSSFPLRIPSLNFSFQTCNLQTFQRLTASFEWYLNNYLASILVSCYGPVCLLTSITPFDPQTAPPRSVILSASFIQSLWFHTVTHSFARRATHICLIFNHFRTLSIVTEGVGAIRQKLYDTWPVSHSLRLISFLFRFLPA